MKLYKCEQGTQEWMDARCGVATASRFGEICTPAKGEFAAGARTYAAELIAERLMGGPDPWKTDYQSRDMQRGSFSEDEARRYYELERNCDVQRVGFCLHDGGQWGCSPDGLIGDDGGLELKCPAPKTHITWLVDGAVPREHLPQVHGGLIVTGREWWDFMSYCPGLPPLLLRVQRDEYTAKVEAALAKFDALLASMLATISVGREAAIAAAIKRAAPIEGPLAAFVLPVEESFF